MPRPRSLSRSTKVAPERSGRNGKRGNRKQKGGQTAATWDHDDTSSDGEAAVATEIGSPSAKKRPRDAADASHTSARGNMSSPQASKRQRPKGTQDNGSSGAEEPESDSPEDDGSSTGGELREDEPEVAAGDEREHSSSVARGGMADVMTKILRQELDDRVQAPVLAKRKTKAMKEMEQAAVKRAESKSKAATRRANMTQQFVVPDHTTADYERQLKKIATRGVVALFNAISKRQNQSGEGEEGNKGKLAAGAAKAASRHAFLDMLKTGVKPQSVATEGSARTKVGGENRTGTSGEAGSLFGRGKSDGAADVGSRSWSALQEDYMMSASSMKNWDQESADSEAEALEGPDAMSADDSD